MKKTRKLVVISFLGPCGAGKSTAIELLSSRYNVLHENYIELNLHQLDNRLMLSKWAFIQYWFNGVLQAKSNGIDLLITDRCPIDTCAYVREGSLELLEILKLSMKELSELNVFVKKVLVTADFDVLQTRINKRLVTDKRRIKYNESDIEHNRRAYNFFHKNLSLWDNIIDTSNVTESNLFKRFDSTILDISHTLK